MIYDPKRRRYIDRGRILTPAEVRKEVDDYIEHQKGEVDKESKKVLLGTLTLVAFFEFMREKIQAWHSIAGVIAYGGEPQMNLERWKRINEKIQSELSYLDKFQVAAEQGFRRSEQLASQIASVVEKDASIPAGLETVVEQETLSAIIASDATERSAAVREAIERALADSVGQDIADTVASEVVAEVLEGARLEELIWGQIGSRARMYADSIWGTHENSIKAREGDAGATGVRRVCLEDAASCADCPDLATEEYVPLDEITDIGDGAACLSNCRCELEFSYLEVEPLTIERELYA